MIKKIGCGIILVGLLMIVLSFTFFGNAIFWAINAQQVASMPLGVDERMTTDIIDVNPNELAQVGVKAHVTTSSVQEETKFNETSYKARYRFPVTYRVLDENGKELIGENVAVRWSGGGVRLITNEAVDSSGGTLTVRQEYEKFEAPSGTIRVEALIEPDSEYGAKASEIELLVFDNVHRHGNSVMRGTLLILLSPALIFMGVVVFVVGLFADTRR